MVSADGGANGIFRTASLRFNLTNHEKDALEAFLRTLTDDALLMDPKFSDPFQ